ncbi:bactofilin family protein [Novosphingobium album (ex Liu et al. 2023)]|uniref:Polymer-forming cytoskeletal protein n=1 Tax=Novosphingobium album (ex Liu et al. 2023) TaxID=3031130 RepID=A0ABT5WPK5_9SPHN|nr:polymer-forming cytoskeletal protein [Novosphingobium album (ex Liu et al. 2023)]MDE8651809.1 polymer-forming cytoskeletal protein [Novosphingobium album (ex Liu et al. 2023)]
MAKAPGGQRPSSSSTFSVLGGDTVIRGDISASADLHVDGRIEGDISCSSLVQGETSEIFGAITAESARISGQVEGSIAARELVVLKTARIRGDISYDALTIEQGAKLEGRLTPHGARPALADPADGNEAHLILASGGESAA